MLSSIHKYFSQNVITIPLNIPVSMAIGYYIDGTKGAVGMATLSVADLVLKYNEYDSYYLSCSSIGHLAGKKIATNLISHYKGLNAGHKDCTPAGDKIEVLDHLLPMGMSAIGIIAAYALNKIEQEIVDYIYDDNKGICLINNEELLVENLEVP